MNAAARGAEAARRAVGRDLCPATIARTRARHLTVAIATGFGEARNAIVARSADAVIAVGGEFGTLSEIALALKMGIPVIGMGTWELGRDDLDRDPIDPGRDAGRGAGGTPAGSAAAHLARRPYGSTG